MKAFYTLLAGVAGFAALSATNPYDGISTRNVFGLRPKVDPPADTNQVSMPKPDFKLTGVAGFGDAKWVLLSKADPGKPPQSFMMREGDREGSLEIVHVDELANLVQIRNDGALVELTFDTNLVAKADLATKKFVEDHTRAHELHQKSEAERIARERAFQAKRKLAEARSLVPVMAGPQQQQNE